MSKEGASVFALHLDDVAVFVVLPRRDVADDRFATDVDVGDVVFPRCIDDLQVTAA